MAATGDKGVNSKSDCLEGKTILLGICGGIAATQSIKIARELRRHGADLSVIMTESAKEEYIKFNKKLEKDCLARME